MRWFKFILIMMLVAGLANCIEPPGLDALKPCPGNNAMGGHGGEGGEGGSGGGGGDGGTGGGGGSRPVGCLAHEE